MSLQLNFEPHSWYKGFAIQKRYEGAPFTPHHGPKWVSYYADGMTYRVVELHSETLKDLKAQITTWRNEYNKKWKTLHNKTH